MGGGTIGGPAVRSDVEGLSPRGRGNLVEPGHCKLNGGPIPARAGEPSNPAVECLMSRAYPRVGGGTASAEGGQIAELGLSPRGRGNRTGNLPADDAQGPIPAWAGEPRGASKP